MDSNIFWTEQDTKDLRTAKTFQELFQIAIQLVQRLDVEARQQRIMWSARERKVIMVCGPITSGGLGSTQKNMEVFQKSIRQLSSRGYLVFNQLKFERAMWRIQNSMTCSELEKNELLLNNFYGALFYSGYIKEYFFIPGWETSFGASWEHDFIKKLGRPIHYLQQQTTAK